MCCAELQLAMLAARGTLCMLQSCHLISPHLSLSQRSYVLYPPEGPVRALRATLLTRTNPFLALSRVWGSCAAARRRNKNC